MGGQSNHVKKKSSRKNLPANFQKKEDFVGKRKEKGLQVSLGVEKKTRQNRKGGVGFFAEVQRKESQRPK